MTISNSILHVVLQKKIFKNFSQSEAFMAPHSDTGKYVEQTSSQEPLDGLEPYLAEMFLTLF
jgi:hypothetical protein